MGPDYDDPGFWDRKFATGQDVGEWLNSGDALKGTVLSELDRSWTGSSPRVLHLGPGISKLGTKLCEEFVSRGWNGNGIVVGQSDSDRQAHAESDRQNVDFSTEAVRLGQEAEKSKDEAHSMAWVRADLRSWTDLSALVPFLPFDIIVDKSTCDAVATSDHPVLSPDMPDISSTAREVIHKNEPTAMTPVELLALNLAELAPKGTAWVALSYSASRFGSLTYLRHWEVVSKEKLAAPSGLSTATGAHAPEIYHYLYVLRRK